MLRSIMRLFQLLGEHSLTLMQKITVDVVREQYSKRNGGEDIYLRHNGNMLEGSIPMKELDTYNDHVIAFEAISKADFASHGNTPAPRQPLQPTAANMPQEKVTSQANNQDQASSYKSPYGQYHGCEKLQSYAHPKLRKSPSQTQDENSASATVTGTIAQINDEEKVTELDFKDQFANDNEPASQVEPEHPQSFQLQNFIADASLKTLEASVEKGVEFLQEVKRPLLDKLDESPDAAQWVQQIERLQKQAVKTKTVIGVVGNTGAGKSSVINAMLDEERLV